MQYALGNNCKTVYFGNIYSDDYYSDETLSTIKYLTRAMRIKNKPKININSR